MPLIAIAIASLVFWAWMVFWWFLAPLLLRRSGLLSVCMFISIALSPVFITVAVTPACLSLWRLSPGGVWCVACGGVLC